MDRQFWLQRWQSNNIGFHKSEANPLLVEHFGSLSLKPGSRVFIPFYGKTLDQYGIALLESRTVPGGLSGQYPTLEKVWQLLPL
jgi:thiopurine S-methyltransferase